MIDLENSYIRNDRGPLLRAWLDEANKQGFNQDKRDQAWFGGEFVFISITGADTSDRPQYTAGKTELTLKDFKPKQFKTEYVKADMSSAEIAKAMIDGEIFYSANGKYSYSWNGIRFVNHLGTDIGIVGKFWRKVETEIQWYENITKPVPCWVSDKDPSAKKLAFLIKEHIADSDLPFAATTGSIWKYATPLTAEDILENF